MSVRLHFGLRGASPPEKNGAVRVHGLGLQLHGLTKSATETKAHLRSFNPSSSDV